MSVEFFILVVFKVLVYGYCGVSVLLFEYILVLYVQVIVDGVDYIELDLVMIRDGVMVVWYENEIGGIIDVVLYLEFVSCCMSKVIDGQKVDGWFIEDFILVELKILYVCECLLELCSIVYDGQFCIVSLDEILVFLVQQVGCVNRGIGLVLEIKYLIYFQFIGLLMEDKLLVVLCGNVYINVGLVMIQLFEIVNLCYLCGRIGWGSNIWLLQLLWKGDIQLVDIVQVGGVLIYVQMMILVGLKDIVGYVDGIGFELCLIILLDVKGVLGMLILLVCDVYVVGLMVILYIFWLENYFQFSNLCQGVDSVCNVEGLIVEMWVYLVMGIDVFFIDDLVLGWQVVDGMGVVGN